ncbi:hypothetical protein A8W25_23490 [Streptomyces sp. ERV7]|uniref:hypothetical protein n=1 Tax=Streptomyces sp. ERV7 TaxID=1322334 RepID=UPI0007F44FA6|nr:hypothetical protein [Streptomyces sp. ERV7]OAR22582.1 hypothetical protein A8W25_23490 [Streptomyces sp. ERV7]
MPDHDPDELASFAAILTQLLPGTWTSAHRLHTAHDDQFFLTADVWDMNQVAEVIAHRPLKHDVILTRDDGRRLFLIDHPHHEDEFLVAAMARADTHAEAFRDVREPDGIAIPADPEQATEAITTHLLPRYESALAQVQDNAARITRPSVKADTLVLTWTETGDLSATTEEPDVAEILANNGFAHDPESKAYVLSGDDTAQQAHSVRTVGARLAALGVGVALRHAPHRAPLGTTPVATPQAPARQVRSR